MGLGLRLDVGSAVLRDEGNSFELGDSPRRLPATAIRPATSPASKGPRSPARPSSPAATRRVLWIAFGDGIPIPPSRRARAPCFARRLAAADRPLVEGGRGAPRNPGGPAADAGVPAAVAPRRRDAETPKQPRPRARASVKVIGSPVARIAEFERSTPTGVASSRQFETSRGVAGPDRQAPVLAYLHGQGDRSSPFVSA